MPDDTIAFAATPTAESVQDSVLLFMREVGIHADLKFAPDNQVFRQLLDPSSLFGRNRRGLNVLLIRLEDWSSAGWRDGAGGAFPFSAGDLIERSATDFLPSVKLFVQESATTLLIIFCPPSIAAASERAFSKRLADLEKFLISSLESVDGVSCIRSAAILESYGVAANDAPQRQRLAPFPSPPAI